MNKWHRMAEIGYIYRCAMEYFVDDNDDGDDHRNDNDDDGENVAVNENSNDDIYDEDRDADIDDDRDDVLKMLIMINMTKTTIMMMEVKMLRIVMMIMTKKKLDDDGDDDVSDDDDDDVKGALLNSYTTEISHDANKLGQFFSRLKTVTKLFTLPRSSCFPFFTHTSHF